jgi:exonuclease SbcD
LKSSHPNVYYSKLIFMKRKSYKSPVAILGFDPHLSKDNVAVVRDLFTQTFALAEEIGCKIVILGGDVFTSRSAQPLEVLDTWREITEDAEARGLEVVAIPGNHDKTDPNSDRSYLSVCPGAATIVSQGSEFYWDGVSFVLIPYYGDAKWLEEKLAVDNGLEAEARRSGKVQFPRFMITHVAVEGVRNNDGTQVESDIRPDMFRNYDAVFVGHYHNASDVGEKVHYLGSMCQNNFGETADDKGVTIIYDDGTWEHHPLRFPRYIRESVSATDTATLRNLMDKYSGETFDRVRIVVTGSKADCEKLNASEFSAAGIEIKFQADETAAAMATASDPEKIVTFRKSTIVKNFMEFCKEREIRGERMKEGLAMLKEL